MAYYAIQLWFQHKWNMMSSLEHNTTKKHVQTTHFAVVQL
jgi:hypothetical protein